MNDEELRLNLKNAGLYSLDYLQKSSINWTEFLRSSSNHYSRDFIEQLLITAHYPNATAVMEKELWKSHHYKVNYAENGIAVFKDFNGEFSNEKAVQAAEIKVYYDISQVHQIAGTTIARWSLGEVDESIVLNTIQKSYSKADTKSLPIAVLTSLESIITEVNSDTKNFIINSSAYQILTRCGYNAKSLFKATDFKYVENIGDTKEFIRIATAVSKASGTMLKLIAKTVRSNYNKNTVSVNKEEKENGINIQSERRLEQGRTTDNLRRVSNGRGWSNDSSDRSQQRETDGTGSIRSEAPEISQGGTSGQIYGADVVGEHNGVSSQHRDDSTEPKGNNNRATKESTGSNRGAESERPNEMGGLDEQHNSISRGDSSSRDNLRLNMGYKTYQNVLHMWEGSYDNKTKQGYYNWSVIAGYFDGMRLLNELNDTATFINEEQLNSLNETGGQKTPVFSFSQEIIDSVIVRGGSVSHSKMRIYEQFEKSLSKKENIDFLKQEYGIGGSNPVLTGTGIDENHDSKGIHLSRGFGNNAPKITLSWEKVAIRIGQLIRMDRYLNPKEKEYYPKWREDQEIKRIELLQLKQEKENKSIPAEKENIEYIYKYAVGDKVYLGASEYEVSSISNDDLIILQDIHFPLMEKEMKREEFENALKESIFNDHLKAPKLTFDKEAFATELDKVVDKFFSVKPLENHNHTGDIIPNTNNSDLFYVDRERESIQWIYYNPDSSAGGQYVVTDFTFEQFNEAYKNTKTAFELFDYIVSEFPISQHLIDLDTDLFNEYTQQISEELPDLVDATEETRLALFNIINNKPLEAINVENEPLQSNIPTITCEWSEHSIFEKGKTYSVSEFDELMENADRKWIKNRREEIEKYGSMEEAIEATGVTYQGYAKTKFTINMPDGSSYTERQDIGDGFGGVIDFLSQYPKYNDIVPVLKEQIAIERNTPIQDVSDTSEVQEQSLNNTKSVDELQVGDVIRLENQEWTISKIDGDFSIELINNDKTANNSVQKFMGHWKENIAEIGFEYIPPVQKRTRNIPTVKSNYIINDDNLGVGTKPERFQNNIKAIRLLKILESENRLATQEEQEILSKYVGWGGLDKYFEPTHSRYNELRECLTDDEFTSASASTLTAFYTPPVVIRAMYKILDNLGFENGNILEPSCGTGNFMGMLPENMQNSKMFGIELDSISGRIAKQLYQKNNISIGGYENEKLPDSFFDVAVGNVPFGNFKVSDKRYNKHKFLIHDYFYAKTLDKVRPGGVIAFITTKGTLDKKDNRVRKYLAERATLLGAIRLPNNTFKGAAGTEVTSDIIFLQKKEALSLDNPDWLYLKENKDGIVINQYFADNPDMVMGDTKLISGPYGQETACLPNENGTLEEKLNTAISKIKGHISTKNEAPDVDEVIESTKIETLPADPTVKNYSYAIVDGDLYFRKNSIMEKQSISGLLAERVRGLIKLRDIVKDLIDYQTNDYPDEDIASKRDELNSEYEKFTKKYGLINSRGNKLAFNQDSSFPLLTSLEMLDEDGKLKCKSDIFYKRTIKPYIPVTHTETSVEALAVSLNERGKVDIEYMAELTGFEQEKVIADLTDIIYPVPGKDEYQTADEYLSGDVRTKLFIAKSVAENDSKYKGNVVALENVQPKDLSAAEVKIRLGATWVDTKYIKQFIDEVFQPGYITFKINVTYSEYTSKWNITSKNSDTSFLARNTYGTKDYNAYQLLELALNLKTPKVYDIKEIDGQEVKVFNSKKTTLARKKQEKIQDKFEEWIFADPQRRNELLRKYNDTYNSIRNRTYNGSHLTFPGMNPEITLRPHQVNAIARTLYGGNTLLAHVVGAGKTFEMIASAMEAKRIGLCNKSLFVVPNHLTEQMGADFLTLYPSANILVATKNDFSTNKRKEFCSRIATGEYDAVIIGHSQFEKIPVSLERQQTFIQEEIDEIINAIAEAKAQNGDNFTIKQLEGEKKKLENKMKNLYADKSKDDVVTFEQLGVDRLFVDEAHKFKNLYIRTKMTNVAGITSSSADKSADLLMKCRYIDEATGGKGIVFATGTPVSNSMSELYTMQRYLQFDTLKKLGFAHFDSWASNFGTTVTASELAPEGKKYREKTRFAKFFNLPELMNIFRECADIQTADMLNLPVPKAEFKTVVAKPSEEQRNFVDECGNRADRVRSASVDPRVDNMLKITTDGRKLAVDQRIVNPELPDFEHSKVNMCVNNVFDIWQDTAQQRSTQLVFCDLSTPTTDGFNVYDDIREKLISKGIPPKEIAFIHNYNTDAKKAALFSDVRQGKIRVLLGSTEKMGAGTNIQDKLVALHDLDCPWRPSDLEQRLGRILRQGNENEEVYVFRYVTEDTFDAYSYQLIENKQKFISQIMSSKTPVREAEDVDQSALSYAEIKMLATGNPLIKEKMDLDIRYTNLKVLKADYLNNKYRLEDMILNIPKEVAYKERFINDLSFDIATVDEHPVNNDEFRMVLNGTTYTDKKTAGMYLLKLFETLPHHVNTDEFTVGEYRGFTLSVARKDNQPYAYLKGYLNYSVEMSDDVYGNITRLNNKLSAISDRKCKAESSLEDYNHQMEKVKLEAQKPFEYEAELLAVTSRLDEVNRMLNTKGNSEYRSITTSELELLKGTDVELDFVTDKSGNGDFIIRFEKVESDKVENALKQNTSNTLRI